MSYKSDAKITNTNTHNEGGSSKHSSNAGEREMRKEATHSEEAARAKHLKQDHQQHPGFANPKKGMP